MSTQLTLAPKQTAMHKTRGFFIEPHGPSRINPPPVFIPVTYEIGYCRDDRSGSFIVTWGHDSAAKRIRQQISVLPGVFFRVLPHLDRRTIANAIFVDKDELTALGFFVAARPVIYA